MISYDLKCADCGEQFEGWFPSSDSFDAQLEAGDVMCAGCGSQNVSKALMAPAIAKSSSRSSPSAEQVQAMARQFLHAVRRHVEDTCDYVGDKLPEEARKIHRGETKDRGIYGEATKEETEELREEGIELTPIPWVANSDA
ncbi:MAG: DUF1178 family protein [Alphaproteobacteria bacterium]|nr:DUF1178 family protein [Alphaproteobacteria bacterium]